MAALTGNSIDSSYQGLLKTTDNGAVGGASKAITDGLGNATNMEIGNAVTKFPSGTVDFTGSSVLGLPAGAAGLENGTGTDSLQSAAALTTNPADASGNGSIAIGDGASATRQESVAIGQGAEANGSGSEGSIAIGHGSIASSNRGIAIGINGTTNSSEGIVIGDDVDISGSDRSVAIGGAINISGGSDKVAIGTSAAVSGNRGLAFGQNASATANEAIAIGYNVTAATANTLSVNGLETQSDSGVNIKGDGTNAGKLKLYCEDAAGTHNVTLEGPAHAGGSSYTLKLPNVQSAGSQILEADASGNLSWINTPGGGGAALHAMGGNLEGRTYYDSGTTAKTKTFRTWVNTTGYGVATAAVSNRAAYSLFTLVPGEDINRVAIRVQQVTAGATGEVAFYDTAVNADGFIYLNNRLQSLGTVDMTTVGWKEITLGTPYTVPTGLTNNTIAIVAFPSTTSANFGGWSNSMAMVGQGIYLISGTPYRALHLHADPGVSPGTALPATIGDVGGGVDYKASTNNPLAVMIN